jgi:hypothetical protein
LLQLLRVPGIVVELSVVVECQRDVGQQSAAAVANKVIEGLFQRWVPSKDLSGRQGELC